MSQDKAERPLLIVGDAAADVRAVRELLRDDCPGLFDADNEEAGVRLFQERAPALLLLAFRELEKSERFYLTLFRQCPTIREIPHQTLLLCTSDEAEAAFSLCRNGTLDDYLVNRPLHDPLRLRLAVRQGLERQVRRAQAASANRQLAHIGSDLRHLDAFVNKALVDGQACHAEGTPREAQECLRQFGEGYREQADRLASHEYPPAQPEVMLVDDDDVYREMLGAMLEEVDVRASLVDGGEAALAEMRRRRPDIVLLDYGMPGLDGMATLRRMKDDPELWHIPVVMLTGVNARETVKEVIMAGAAGFIVKPSNRSTILARIRNLLSKTSENTKWE